ncbi:threonine-tRNA ligase [Edhazardia aedis USNM 41457]|uniref:Probable threonine--tRNA ligase, cytoplasmic n=1 Tax=Edhazardia aedis (strain USNM 41457) TaxID=1003232 RepID=J9DLA5_EDHAE|nr:threonine-tRNA ligase [Edhazardia aedis USNM 41457]|eukprot:EJW03375.1 threonine-tRNA ligase [Edhazardia aedis USNM 41457]
MHSHYSILINLTFFFHLKSFKTASNPLKMIKITHNGTEYNEEAISAYDFLIKHQLGHPLLCKIDGVLSDLSTEITKDCMLESVNFETDDGREVFWHSSAHILGYALLEVFPDALLSHGPPTEKGFYYDVKVSRPITQEDYVKIEQKAKDIVKRNYKFTKILKTKEELLSMYRSNKYKTHYVSQIQNSSTVYKIGTFEDFCLGPHIHSTKVVKAFKVLHHSSSYFLGNSMNDNLQRVYAISFPNTDDLKKYLKMKEEAKLRDHRRIGTDADLFFFSELSPGSCFFLPKGCYIYNTLADFLRKEYKKRGFKEVISPNIYSTKLWETSGHLSNYKENMFCFNVDDQLFALKPMNCPGHCLMFKNSHRSYKSLPLRFADFGVLHRNELSGALSGLTRVRRFQQDDAHIFCTEKQVQSEIESCLDFVDFVYKKFNFKYDVKLSTRPEKFIGTVETWDLAENALKTVLKRVCPSFVENKGDGAFYGPKIDITLEDALGRKHQCATIQLDFQLPTRFNLQYLDADGELKVPVLIHRAIFGSLERMIAVIVENFGLKLPFWLCPWQAAIVCVNESNIEYANYLLDFFADYNVDLICDQGLTLNKKIRNAEVAGYKFILVVGNKEQQEKTVNVRNVGVLNIDVLLDRFANMVQSMKEYNDLYGDSKDINDKNVLLDKKINNADNILDIKKDVKNGTCDDKVSVDIEIRKRNVAKELKEKLSLLSNENVVEKIKKDNDN